jgi:hypothetical protein
MPFKGKRYPEVEGKTVEYIETNDEEGLMTVYVRLHRRDSVEHLLCFEITHSVCRTIEGVVREF